MNLIKNLSEKIIENEKNYVTQYFNDLNKFKISTENKYLDKFFNEWLMYQIVSSRFFGRCGYYQAGGAYGFRDQLQDMLSIIYSDTDIVRKHILLCAKMQFIEGDVMHWWHPPKFGVRTRISDDKLFLPYVAAKYIEVTGDYSILDENIEYLKSNELSEKEHSRLESPESSEYKEPLIKHLLKALDSSLKFGENNLLLIGSGDWNDGLDNVGIKNKGESVWLSMFCYEVINLLLPYIDCDKRIYYIECADKIKKAVEKCYDGDRFIRCITDDGEVLGKETSKVCKLDILTQCFSVFSNIVDIDKQKKSLRTAESLIDYENGLIKLLSPPFGKEKYYGYICSYPKGVRENGGQYTHAAVWYISALAKIGLREKAYELLNLILPPNKCDSPEKYNKYKGEPYVIAADVYSNEFNNGRMGWSWYTGSASWLYKTILEDIIGIKIIKKALIIEPKLPEQLGECFVEYRYKNAVYNIKIKKCGTSKTTIDKISVSHGYIPLVDKKKIFNVEYYF